MGLILFFFDAATLHQYGHDETEDLSFPPQILVKPKSSKEIAAIVKLANEYNVSVVPIGGQTGLSGGLWQYMEVLVCLWND